MAMAQGVQGAESALFFSKVPYYIFYYELLQYMHISFYHKLTTCQQQQLTFIFA